MHVIAMAPWDNIHLFYHCTILCHRFNVMRPLLIQGKNIRLFEPPVSKI